MRVIITGGTGSIGKPLSANLAADGRYEVIVLSRNPSNYAGKMPAGVKVEKWDASSADGWGHLADGAFAIINLAGAGVADKRWTRARKFDLLESRVNAGKAVVEAVAAAEVKPKVVMQASAVGYYGAEPNDAILTETSPSGSDFLADVSKQWEPATDGVKSMGVRHVIIRTGVVFMLEGGALPKLLAPFNMMAGGPLGSGEQWMSWIHINDQIRAMRFLLENESAEGIYNLSAPNPVQNSTLGRKIGHILNKPALLPAPAFALKAMLGEMATVVLDGQRVIPARLMKEGFIFQFSDVETAIRDLLRQEVAVA